MSESTHDAPAQVIQPEDIARVIEKTTVLPWSLPIGDSRKMFKDLTSANGKKYRVECEIPDDEDKDEWISANSHVFDVIAPTGDDSVGTQEKGGANGKYYADANVHWPYVKDGDFQTPDKTVVNDLHITQYRLGWNTGGYADYRLDIMAIKKCLYTFYCGEGDEYTLLVEMPYWRHNITYDSSNPCIVRIHAVSDKPF